MEATSTPKRPLSAIFLGNSGGSLSVETHSNAEGSGLPSPPATNSTASTGKESLPKRVRKTSIAFATVKSMLTGERRQHTRDIQREELVEDEDHTARLSGPTASTSSDGSQILGRSSIGARSTSSGGLDRVRSLADRNRMVLDKLSSISSAASSRLGSPAPNDRVPLTASTLRSRNVSPMPPLSASTLFPPKSNASTGSSPRGAYATLPSPNGRSRDDSERISPSDSGASSGKGPEQSFRGSIVGRRASARDSPRVREVEFTVEHDESTTPKERERLYEQQRAPPVFSVSGDGNSSGVRREGSVRVSFSRTRPEMDVDEFGMSGTRQRVYSTESDDRSITPPADASRRFTIDSPAARPRRVSINEPDSSPTKPREPLRTRAAAGTIGRQRNSSEIIERTVAAARKSPVRSRGALPSEFRSSTESKRASFDNKRFSLDGKRTFSRSSNSPELPRRDSGLNRASPVTSGTRAATVRESSRRTHSRWASEDVSGDNEAGDRPRPRYERRGGSIESPITPGGRSVVGESFRAAGLTKRRDPEPPAPATTNRATAREPIDWEIEELRNGISRVGVGDGRIHEEDDDDDDDDRERSVTPDNKRVQARNIQNIVTSRPGTSNGDYIEEGPRTAPPALRPYRSMNTGLITPSGSGTVRGATPVTPAMLVSATSTEHVRLMLESFAMFESNLARAEGTTSGGGSSAVSELLQNADVVVQASQRLNTLLRESAARALTEQIESEVEDRDVREMEIWKLAGGEFRDALKVCDELVRSMTNLLLGVGRVVKERGDEDHTRSSGRVSSSEIRSGRMSAEGIRTGRMSAEGIRSGRMSAEGLRSGRMSAEGLRSGRMSAEGLRPRVGDTGRLIEEGRRNAEVRRSLDGGPGDALSKLTSREATRWHDPMRPSTSMSLLRERGRVSPIDTNPVRQSTSRRFFPQSSSDADTSFGTDSYQTPSPAARVMPNGEHHHRERMLSIPPSLETVPSESIVRKAEKTPTITRRPRMSVGTVRGAAPFPTSAPAPAPTQLSTAIAIGNGSPEKGQRSISYTVSRSGGAATVSAMTGLQAQARKRTISAADPMDEMSSPTEMSDGATQRLQSTITRSRASVDFSADEGTTSGSERRPRRRTATELFT